MSVPQSPAQGTAPYVPEYHSPGRMAPADEAEKKRKAEEEE